MFISGFSWYCIHSSERCILKIFYARFKFNYETLTIYWTAVQELSGSAILFRAVSKRGKMRWWKINYTNFNYHQHMKRNIPSQLNITNLLWPTHLVHESSGTKKNENSGVIYQFSKQFPWATPVAATARLTWARPVVINRKLITFFPHSWLFTVRIAWDRVLWQRFCICVGIRHIDQYSYEV